MPPQALPDEVFRHLVESESKRAAVSLDAGGQVRVWSGAAQEISGYSANAMTGRRLGSLLMADREGESTWEALRLQAESTGGAAGEIAMTCRDGNRRGVELTLVCHRHGGEVTGYSVWAARLEDRIQIGPSKRDAADLERAINGDELRLVYQPQVRLGTGEIRGYEALVRWQHPTRGLTAPGEFIPLAEATGLIHPLTQWVLDRAVGDAAAWRRAGVCALVAVNVSVLSLADPELVNTVRQTLVLHDLEPAHVEIEVTESGVMRDPVESAYAVRALQLLGVTVSMDDFGAGQSSLGSLKTLPVNALKIDRGLVYEIDRDAEECAIVECVLQLAGRLGIEVIAEGVETEACAETLAHIGCPVGQGFALGRPAPAVDWGLEGEGA